MTPEQRLERIERQLKFYKMTVLLFGGIVCFAVFSGMRAVNQNCVSANKFVLVDGCGNEVGVWEANEARSHLTMRSSDTTYGVGLSVNNGRGQQASIMTFRKDNFVNIMTKTGAKPESGIGIIHCKASNENKEIIIKNGTFSDPSLIFRRKKENRVEAVAGTNKSFLTVAIEKTQKELTTESK